MKCLTVPDVTLSAAKGLRQRRTEILRSAQNDKHFLLSLVARRVARNPPFFGLEQRLVVVLLLERLL
jgi:hypothetical protein